MNKNLVKRQFCPNPPQVIENAAKINFANVMQHPIAKCYSEYIE
jgi:hypothetical protein